MFKPIGVRIGSVPLGVQLEEVVTFVAGVGAGQADAGGLAALRRAGAAGVQRLPLHVALQRRRSVQRSNHSWSGRNRSRCALGIPEGRSSDRSHFLPTQPKPLPPAPHPPPGRPPGTPSAPRTSLSSPCTANTQIHGKAGLAAGAEPDPAERLQVEQGTFHGSFNWNVSH